MAGLTVKYDPTIVMVGLTENRNITKICKLLLPQMKATYIIHPNGKNKKTNRLYGYVDYIRDMAARR